ncbi:MAG: flavodoxin family protein [Clostridiales bacterium]|nr:flavodoxin family protein [Clostridiales bacterium]
MKTAICYYSRHHGNTLAVLDAMTEGCNVDLIDVTVRMAVRLDQYDRIGFASGIYFSKFSPVVVNFARQYLPEGREVFFVYTYGAPKVSLPGNITAAVKEKGCRILGQFGCRGYDTFGPFKLIGGLAKGHPDAQDLKKAKQFFEGLGCRE